MPGNYLHGVETIRVNRRPRAISVVKSAVILLLGTAPVGPANALTLLLSDRDAAQFGPQLPGFTMSEALDGIYDQGAATVIALNVLDTAVHRTTAPDETIALDGNGRFKTSKPGLLTLTVKSSDGATTYVKDTDYTIDMVTGAGVRLPSGAIQAGASLKLGFAYADPSKVTPADIIGTVDIVGRRLGLKALGDCYNQFGFVPKILIAPGFATLSSVSSELIAAASKYGAKALIDAPVGMTVQQVVASRGPVNGSNFNTSSPSAILCYPHVQIADPATGIGTKLQPLSIRMAGVMAAKDMEKGYHWSPSNTEIKGIVGIERSLTAKIDDPQSEVNLLNEVGICTVFNSFGTGYRTWGNRCANFPTETGLETFIPTTRVQDVIDESIRYFSLPFIDQPFSDAVVDAIVQSVNQFMNKLVGDTVLIGGLCWFDPARNSETERANGRGVFNYKFTPPPPFERGTYESEMTGEYLVSRG